MHHRREYRALPSASAERQDLLSVRGLYAGIFLHLPLHLGVPIDTLTSTAKWHAGFSDAPDRDRTIPHRPRHVRLLSSTLTLI